ncbi:hypothetical protein CFAM422_004435 [Trichoderma lentiforme]|uniref:Uncharacterized protein n=1 Tax=Trichoderma lentiforme TaxID=1567552 RepID=A0A9P4XK85_9HYPO|nr:hypothetical protein CFAM422_004435 [Trichoderma lentiforme]
MSSNQRRTVANAGRKPLQKDPALAAFLGFLGLTVPAKAQDEISQVQISRRGFAGDGMRNAAV